MGGTLRWDDSSGREELVDGGAQVGYLSSVQGPVVELRLPHALLQTWQTDTGDACLLYQVINYIICFSA